jgi:hypothetical protein
MVGVGPTTGGNVGFNSIRIKTLGGRNLEAESGSWTYEGGMLCVCMHDGKGVLSLGGVCLKAER